MFSSSVSDVAEATGLGLLWSRLFYLLIRNFWAIEVLLLVYAIFFFLVFSGCKYYFAHGGCLHRLVLPQDYSVFFEIVIHVQIQSFPLLVWLV